MAWSRRCLLVCVVLCILSARGMTCAADDVLKAIPKNALGFVVVNRLGQCAGKIQDFGRQMQLPVPDVMRLLDAQADNAEGLDDKGAAALVFLQIDEDELEPAGILLLPVSDYDKFLQRFKAAKASDDLSRIQLWSSTFMVRKLGSFAAVAQTQHREVLASLPAAGNIPAEIKPLAPWIAENEISAALTRYGIQALATRVQSQLADLKETLGTAGDETQVIVGVLSAYDQFFGLARREAAALAVGVRLESSGTLRIAARLRLRHEGDLGPVLSQVPVAEGQLLAGLPREPYMFALGAILPEQAKRALVDWSGEMLVAARSASGLSEDQARKLAAVSRATVEDIEAVNFLLAAGKEAHGALLHNMAATMKVKDSRAFLADYEKQIVARADLAKEAKTDRLGKPTVEKLKFDGMEALKVTVSVPPIFESAAAEMDGLLEKLFGAGGKITVHIAAVNPTTVAMTYGNQDLLRRAVETIKSGKAGLAADPQLMQTAALLPQGPQAVGYWSLSGTIQMVNRAILLFGLDQQGIKPLPEPPAVPPIGFAVRVVPDEIQKECVIPGEVVKKARDYVLLAIAAMQVQ